MKYITSILTLNLLLCFHALGQKGGRQSKPSVTGGYQALVGADQATCAFPLKTGQRYWSNGGLLPLGGQTRSRQSPNKQRSNAAIRKVDFLNFTYHPTICNQLFEVGGTVRLRQGEYKNDAGAYYGVGKVIYGHLAVGDNNGWAIVQIGCGNVSANWGPSELLIYAIHNGRIQLITSINDEDMERDYRRYYPNANDELWRITDTGVRVANGSLIVERFAGGSHACPQHIVTFKYELGELGAGEFDEYGRVNCGAYPLVKGSNRMGNFSLYHTGCGAVELSLNEQPQKRPARLSCR